MPFRSIPAPGYTRISGHRAPPKDWGDKLYCQIRNGWCDTVPWPVSITRWKWDLDTQGKVIEHPGDVVAVRKP